MEQIKQEIDIADVRGMIGGYVLELIVKDKEIAHLKAKISELESSRENVKSIRPIEKEG